MASSGKKGKKSKGKTLPLTDFLQETPGVAPTVPIRKTNINWADDVDDGCDQYDSRPKANVVLPTAPKASRGLEEYRDKIPQNPPYNAYLSNLPYDVTEDEIADFFGDLRIAAMRIPKDDRPGEGSRLKGFGYVEFEDRDSLIGALSIADTNLKNRRIRIEVATNSDSDRRRGRMDMNRDRGDRPEAPTGDWRSGPRSEPQEQERRMGGGFGRDRDNGSFERGGGSNSGGSWRDNTDRPSFREFDRDRGFQRDSGFGDRSRMGDRDDRRSGFGPRRYESDRDKEISRSNNREDSGFDRSEQRSRPKLNLAPRTKQSDNETPAEQKNDIQPEQPKSAGASSSIFGSARPVDTSARERQIEDRLAKENEKAIDTSRDTRREHFSRDWGRRGDSPKRSSPRRKSPRKYSPRRYSPRRDSRDRGYSPRRDSRDRTNSPRRDSRERGDSRDRKHSPRRDSGDRKYSPRRDSRDRNYSPARNSQNRRRSPDRGYSPRRTSTDRRDSSVDRSSSSERRDYSSKKDFNDGRHTPESRNDNNKTSPDRKQSLERKKSDKNSSRKNEDKDRKGPSREKGDRIKKDNQDKDVKLKEPDTVTVSNKYAFLEAEGDDSD